MHNDLSSPASIRGLSEADAQAKLKTEGYNELPRPDRRTPLRIILEVVREPMLALLLGGGVIYLALGDLKEALILLAFATMSVVITVVQETRTERVLEALRDLTSPRASGHSRWRAQTNRRPGSGARRFCRARRGGSGAGRCGARSKPRSADRRVAADRRVRARAQDRQWRGRSIQRPAGRVATTCHMCSPARWSCAGPE